MAAVEKFRKNPESGRTTYLLELDSIEDWPEEISLPKSKHFVLFLATDASDLHEDDLAALATRCLDQGMVYLSAWGVGSERLHDIFEEAAADWDPDSDADNALGSEWHEDEPLSEALLFAVASANPASEFEKTCSATLVVVVGDPDAAEQVREWMKDARSLARAAENGDDVDRAEKEGAAAEEDEPAEDDEEDEDLDLDDEDEDEEEDEDEDDDGADEDEGDDD
jgi:hypothetical protein